MAKTRCPPEAPKSSKWCEEQAKRIVTWKPWKTAGRKPKKTKEDFTELASAWMGVKP